jgi:hypothetical protein
MEHVSVNCEEFDNLLIKNFNLDTLFSSIEQYHYISLALFNMKSFDETLFNYIKKNYTSFEKLKSLEFLGYNIRRIGTLKEISLNFGELQTEIIRYFFHKGPIKVNSNSPQEIQKNFLIEEVEEEETFDYDQIEFEYEASHNFFGETWRNRTQCSSCFSRKDFKLNSGLEQSKQYGCIGIQLLQY